MTMDILEANGYRIRTYEGFMSGAVDLHSLDGCQHMAAAEIRAAHDAIREELRGRAAQHDGTHVVYDPSDDGDGWLLVGEESAIRAETERMIADALRA
jgi:hypothetical protein